MLHAETLCVRADTGTLPEQAAPHSTGLLRLRQYMSMQPCACWETRHQCCSSTAVHAQSQLCHLLWGAAVVGL